MKILAVDDNAVARTVLRAFLERSGYEPVIAEDGAAALAVMQAPDAPQIAIVDWMMPGMSGPELCTKLRALELPHRPYLVLLTSKTDKADIAQGLDAGADEFITKPFNQVEMLARLRAARRVVEREAELQQRIDELAALVERHHVLEDLMVTKNGPARPPETTPPAEAPAAQAPLVEPCIDVAEIEIIESVQRSMTDLGWDDATVSASLVEGPYARPPLMAWAGFFLDPVQMWLDFLLEAEPEPATALFEKSMRKRPANDRALLDYLAEMLNLVTANTRSFIGLREGTVIAPFLSRGLRMGSLSKALPMPPGPRQAFRIAVGGVDLGLTLVRNACPVRVKSAGQLNASEILAEAFQPSEAYHIPLLNRGTVLNERFIERLVAFARSEGMTLKVPVFEPSPIAAYFNPKQGHHPLRPPTAD